MTRQTSNDEGVNVEDSKVDAFCDRMVMAIKLAGGSTIMAEKAGVSTSVLSKWRRGSSEPTRTSLIKLAQAAGVSVEWLATGQGPVTEAEATDLDAELAVRSTNLRDNLEAGAAAHEKPANARLARPEEPWSRDREDWYSVFSPYLYARMAPVLVQCTDDPREMEKIMVKVVMMVEVLTKGLEAKPDQLPQEHLEQLVDIAAAALRQRSNNQEDHGEL